MVTGTTAAGRSSVNALGQLNDGIAMGAGVYTFETDVYMPLLSTVAEEFSLYHGFGDSIIGDQTDGTYFKYNRLTSVNWLACTASGGVRTETDTGIPVTATTWIRLRVVVNPLATAAYFYINNVLVATNIANLPAGVNTGAVQSIIKSAGLTSRVLWVDWTWLHYDLSVSR